MSKSAVSSSTTILISPNSENIQYKGRIDTSNLNNEGAYYFDWPGIQITLVIKGTSSIKAVLQSKLALNDIGDLHYSKGNKNIFDIVVNGTFHSVFTISSYDPKMSYSLFDDGYLSSDQTYVVTLIKRTEAAFGRVSFFGFIVDSTYMLLPPPIPRSRRLLFLGDSITCGYGNMVIDPCEFSVETENVNFAYGSLIAKQLEADAYFIAWSGIGLSRNCDSPDTTSKVVFKDMWTRTLATNSSLQWEAGLYLPDAVIINLGTNDFITQPNPPRDIFIEDYTNLVKAIHNIYSNKPKIFLACGPMIGDPCCSYVQSVADSIDGVTYIDMQNILVTANDIGCRGHPGKTGNIKMANIACPIIQKVMEWD
ncbi:hypothetical protein SAMD00019534_002200 [Acytostelium subglobosum LB1]|uniref:hypothetical protein n=1 Tax=Acytostelium subglobosum LB1 TaxID=1410327 RepID=UPI000644D8B8|nr:hypothetical protein SAMD00019534_002200 [Acytostelium subglobosum LB1]GAM17045.1 hypothetical protein SAMD00019534_002200 [Acytostelium subglobosum LB1]|eukprot:XP_012759107.1 hypothetical protein SAMD00019534_002200 [Acytostelium subglobosum LB1]